MNHIYTRHLHAWSEVSEWGFNVFLGNSHIELIIDL